MKIFRNILWILTGCCAVLLIIVLTSGGNVKLFVNTLLIYFFMVNIVLLCTVISIVCKIIKHISVQKNEILLTIVLILMCIPIDLFAVTVFCY